MLAIKNNIMAASTARHLGNAYDALARSVEKLSSGLRIVSAKDDAAGMAVRELVRADIAVLEQGVRNAQDGISMLQTMEAAMAVVDQNLIRMKQLAEQAATGSYSDAQRAIMNSEFEEMAEEINRVANATKFNNIAMLNSGSGWLSIHVGTTDTIDVDKVDMTPRGLGIETGEGGYKIETGFLYGAENPQDDWLVITGESTQPVTLTVSFDVGTETATFDVTLDDEGTYSMQDIAAAINEAAQDASQQGGSLEAYPYKGDAAEVFYDYTHNLYRLRITSSVTDATSGTIEFSVGDIEEDQEIKVNLAGNTVFWVVDSGGTETTNVDNDDVGWWEATDAPALNILTADAAQSALLTIESAITAKEDARASFGYKMNRLESAVEVIQIQIENLQAAESRISDVDVATEMAKLTSTNVLAQAGVAMLAQANAMPQMALTLLR
ncbi:MAG: flagellin [Sedimentisphaerales bacterium]|nr:flagellin [Sedimentisphaerales bacterium]